MKEIIIKLQFKELNSVKDLPEEECPVYVVEKESGRILRGYWYNWYAGEDIEAENEWIRKSESTAKELCHQIHFGDLYEENINKFSHFAIDEDLPNFNEI